MVNDIFDAVSEIITDFVGTLSNGLQSVGGIFYSYDATDGLSLTFLGSVALIAVGAGLVWLIYRLIKGAIRGIGR